jgi:hypothetical protein
VVCPSALTGGCAWLHTVSPSEWLIPWCNLQPPRPWYEKKTRNLRVLQAAGAVLLRIHFTDTIAHRLTIERDTTRATAETETAKKRLPRERNTRKDLTFYTTNYTAKKEGRRMHRISPQSPCFLFHVAGP